MAYDPGVTEADSPPAGVAGADVFEGGTAWSVSAFEGNDSAEDAGAAGTRAVSAGAAPIWV